MDNVLNNILYNALADSLGPVYLFVMDMKTGITRWSKNFREYFGIQDEYTDKAREVWIRHIHPDDREAYQADLNKAVVTRETNYHEYQYRALNKDGVYVWVECRGKVETDEKGNQIFAGMVTRLDSQSVYDPLTRVKTKQQFHTHNFTVEEGIVAIFGIDHFKHTIATFGYEESDELLVHVGQTLIDLLKSPRHIYRFGADEFLCIIPNGNMEMVNEIFEALKERTMEFEFSNGLKTSVSFSGAAVEYGKGMISSDGLINDLESTLLYVKKESRGSVLLYSQDIKEQTSRTAILKKELKASIANKFAGFELYFQPWMDEMGVSIVGCETLLRWKGETIKDSYPGEFIPILEETNDIISVGHFVMHEAMRMQREWSRKYGELLVSFNVSYEQFLQDGYVEDLEATARGLGINPSNMVIELTESRDVQSPEVLSKVFTRLRKLGFKIALDDFGTGYASMEMLRKLPSDGVKIEHSFVRELSTKGHEVDYAIIKSIMLLCEELGQQVIVEGVENAEVDAIIKGIKGGYLQGYYYSRPVCKADFEKLLEENIKKNGGTEIFRHPKYSINRKEFIRDLTTFACMDNANPDTILQRFTQYLCENLDSDRAYIFENNNRGTVSNTYEYCRDGVEPQKEYLQEVPLEVLENVWYKEYKKSGSVLIFDLEEYRPKSEDVYQLLKPQNVNTLVTGPITINGEIIGMYGVDNPPKEMMADISALLSTLEIFLSMMIRLRDNSK